MSRFVIVEKQEVVDMRAEMARMADVCPRVMRDAGRYRRRMFRAMPPCSPTYRARTPSSSSSSRTRASATCWRRCSPPRGLCRGRRASTPRRAAWLGGYMDDAMRTHADRIEDEERVVSHILEAQIRTDEMRTRTVAELLLSADGGAVDARDLLARHGMRLYEMKNGDGNRHRYLAMAQHSTAIGRC